MGKKRESIGAEVVWNEAAEELTLEGEPVLRYSLSWPSVQNGGPGGRWISCCYGRLAQNWRQRWRREVYWQACLALVECRASGRPFEPWSGRLWGRVTLWKEGVLSLCMEGEEIRGDGRPCRVKWGDIWNLREGSPVTPRAWFGKGWTKKKAAEQILRQGRERQAGGVWLPDGDWEDKVKRAFVPADLWLTEEGARAALPQSVLAPAAEGTPEFEI